MLTSARAHMRVLVMGSDALTARLLRALKPAATQLHCVVPPDRPFGRRGLPTPSAAKAHCLETGVGFTHAPASSADEWTPVVDVARAFDLAVVFSFGYKLPPNVIAAPALGTVNIHPSLLPRYRGAAPIQHALLNDDKETGVSLIEVHPARFDVGDILAQQTHAIRDSHTLASLSGELADVGSCMVLQLLQGDELARARAQRVHQADLAVPASKASRLPSELARADWSLPARVLFNRARALDKLRTSAKGQALSLSGVRPPRALHNQAGVGDVVADGDCVLVRCGDAQWLPFTRAQFDGKKELDATVFAHGHMKGGRAFLCDDTAE